MRIAISGLFGFGWLVLVWFVGFGFGFVFFGFGWLAGLIGCLRMECVGGLVRLIGCWVGG